MADLLNDVAQQLNVTADVAAKALGVVFTAVRMGVDPQTFGAVADAFPAANDWMRDTPVGGGRTGEMLALASPETVRRSLGALGLDEGAIQTLGHLAGQAMAAALPEHVVQRITARFPLLGA